MTNQSGGGVVALIIMLCLSHLIAFGFGWGIAIGVRFL